MIQYNSQDRVLLAVFKAAGCNADIAVDDQVWMMRVEPAKRQEAVEDAVIRLAQSGCIRRAPGTVALTAKALAYLNAHPKEWRMAG